MSKRSYAERKQQFLHFVETARSLGIAHPEIIAAQWALESDYGNRHHGNFNYWGVKAGNGDPNNDADGVVGWTKEVINGKTVKVKQKFKNYNSLEEALLDRKAFTNKKGGRYDKAGYFSASSPYEAAIALQKGGYATDPDYADKLMGVIKGFGLNPYEGQTYDFSTPPQPENIAVQQPVLQNFAQTTPLDQIMQPHDEPINDHQKQQQALAQSFYQLNDTFSTPEQAPTLTAFEPPEPPDYSEKLASAFGIAPSTQGKIPDHIGDMIKSIYDQTT